MLQSCAGLEGKSGADARISAFDSQNLLLYVHISQTFRIWKIPFYYAPVSLVTVLQLNHNKADGKYYIESQNDLYQVDQFIKFVFPGGWLLVWLWQFWATAFCLLGAVALWPVSFVEEWMGQKDDGPREVKIARGGRTRSILVDEIDLLDAERKGSINR